MNAEIPLPARKENRKGIRPLAVSVDEALKTLIDATKVFDGELCGSLKSSRSAAKVAGCAR